jgi:hypothetical protein
MCRNVRWHANLVLLNQSGNMQQERASGRTIRGCLSVRGYASAAGVTLVRQSFLALRCTIRGRSISRFPPPTEIQKWVCHQARRIVPLSVGKRWPWPLNITEAATMLGEPAATAFVD